MLACVYACVRTRVRACVYAPVRVCMRDMFAAIYDKILDQADNNNKNYYPYKSDTLMISPQRVYRLVYIMATASIIVTVYVA